MKRILLVLTLISAGFLAIAQNDELPPPTSSPENRNQREEEDLPKAEDFKGFKKNGKVDLSKFIIEPIVYFSISQNRIDVGLSPSVGYQVFKPKNANPRNGNTGLFIGGGVTYFYTKITEAASIPGTTIKYDVQTYGAGPLIQYNIWKGLFARTKVELLGRKIPYSVTYYGNNSYKVDYIRKFTPSVLVGAGYNLLQSKNFFLPVAIYYNILHPFIDHEYSVYPRGVMIQLGYVSLF